MRRLFYILIGVGMFSIAHLAIAEDIDLFASGLADSAAAAELPNVIFVLDNTSNWSRQSQKWPEATQGQSEVRAIRSTLERVLDADRDLNVAIMEFTTGGSANTDGGFIRFDLRRLSENKDALWAVLDEIDQNIESPAEKRNANSSYGNLASDIYAYLAGEAQRFAGSGTPTQLADPAGYASLYGVFESPLSESDICAETYVILISNPDNNGPERDSLSNSDYLGSLYTEAGEVVPAALAGGEGEGLLMPEYEASRVSSADVEVIGYSALGYQRATECSSFVNGNPLQSSEIQAACPTGGGCYCVSRFQRCEGDLKCYQVERPVIQTQQGSYGTTGREVDGVDYNLDDWTRFMHELGVPVGASETLVGSGDAVRVPVTTYTVDVFNAQPSPSHSSLMHSAAEQGGGYRQAASNQAEIERALTRIFGDIIDINTTFAAVTLPLSATNRAQAENKVFVGMFRPASQRKPRWLGNLKQYQLAKFDGQVELADVNYNRAINPQTGFAQSCATSFWTEDTSAVDKQGGAIGPYFAGLGMQPSPTSNCVAEFRGDRSMLSDSPDGPFVEKGGAAQQIRSQYSGSHSSTRTILTDVGDALTPVTANIVADDTVLSSEAADIYAYLVGEDAGLRGGDLMVRDAQGTYVDNPYLGESEEMPYLGLRPTIHGDIVHSRPLTITYGPPTSAESGPGSQFRIFYGANDGLFRSLDPSTGEEDWAFIARDHLSGIARLRRNTPTVDFFGLDDSLSADIGAEKKQYFFDGSTGSYTEYDQDNRLTKAWVFLSMRRGGRQIYALDVSPEAGAGIPPHKPKLKWRVGCSESDNDVRCDEGFEALGETWSTPVAGRVKGFEGDGSPTQPDPVLIFGGGWDPCLDADQPQFDATRCERGNGVYILNANSGQQVAEFPTKAPVVADVSVLDIDNDGFLDFAYVADAAGNLYRLNFATLAGLRDASASPLTTSEWSLTHIAASALPHIRFLNKPVIGAIQNRVFVTIGSGDRERPLKQNYPFTENVGNRFYALVDEPYDQAAGVINLDRESTATERSMLNAADGLPAGQSLIELHRGWFVDLPDQGEQVVNPSAIGGGYVFFNSYQPEGGTGGLCRDLGKSKAYQIPLFSPRKPEGKTFGQGIPIPPVIATVRLNTGGAACSGSYCGEGEAPNEIVTVCIGCEGFNPVEIAPDVSDAVREAYQAEDIDRL